MVLAHLDTVSLFSQAFEVHQCYCKPFFAQFVVETVWSCIGAWVLQLRTESPFGTAKFHLPWCVSLKSQSHLAPTSMHTGKHRGTLKGESIVLAPELLSSLCHIQQTQLQAKPESGAHMWTVMQGNARNCPSRFRPHWAWRQVLTTSE